MTTELARLDLRQLAIPGVELTPTGLSILDADLPYESLEQVVMVGAYAHSAAKFWIGDALNFGERVFGERYAQMEALTRMNPHTLENIASVCRRVANSRRREELSFSHHEVVARLEPREQVEWLKVAVENDWRVDEFRLIVREAIPPQPRGEQPKWTDNDKSEPELLSLDQVEETEVRARKALASTLPATHPLWETQAKSLARDALDLAATAKESLRDVVVQILEQAQPYGNLGYWIPTSQFERLSALVSDESDEGGSHEQRG